MQGLQRRVQALFEQRHAGSLQPRRALDAGRANLAADHLELHQAAGPGGAIALAVGDTCGQHVGDDLVLGGTDLLGKKQAA
ncbi:hypothetical protein D3C84_737960 [compost metagenome]